MTDAVQLFFHAACGLLTLIGLILTGVSGIQKLPWRATCIFYQFLCVLLWANILWMGLQ